MGWIGICGVRKCVLLLPGIGALGRSIVEYPEAGISRRMVFSRSAAL
jgi:hypothetical protein